ADDEAVAGPAGKTTTPGAADHGPGGGRVDGGADGVGDVLARVGATLTRSTVVSPVGEVSKGRVAPGAVHRRCRMRGGATGKTGHGDGCSDACTEEHAARPRGGGFLRTAGIGGRCCVGVVHLSSKKESTGSRVFLGGFFLGGENRLRGPS